MTNRSGTDFSEFDLCEGEKQAMSRDSFDRDTRVVDTDESCLHGNLVPTATGSCVTG